MPQQRRYTKQFKEEALRLVKNPALWAGFFTPGPFAGGGAEKGPAKMGRGKLWIA